MMRRAAIILLISLTFPCLIMSQGETSNWYFGNGAGITFNNDGSVTPLLDGKLSTFEGCATISDTFGQLLFYTDGIIVYNKNHTVMDNGTGLYGDPSSTQSALIVPKPGSLDIFYIVTVDTSIGEDDPDEGLNYSVVDMTANNGLGRIVQKNVNLLKNCSEKVAAVVKDCTDQSIWLLSFASADGRSETFDTFHAFEINNTGFTPTALTSTFSDLNITDARGYLKLSPDGTKLANANMRDGLYAYDFNAETGLVSNQLKLSITGAATASYGLEFSPNSQFLYVHASNDVFSNAPHQSSLVQFDLFAPDIRNSQVRLDSRELYRGALQLGDNGKIYRTNANSYFQGTPFLSVIHNPNQKGNAANYEHQAISLNGKNGTQGLPPFIQSFFNKIELVKNADGSTQSSISICEGESIRLEANLEVNSTYEWRKDGNPITTNGNILEIPNSTIGDSGKYSLTITSSNPAECPIVGEALVSIFPIPNAPSITLEQCDVDENPFDGTSAIDLTQAIYEQAYTFTFYETLQDQIDDSPIENPNNFRNTQTFNQTLYYKIVNENDCENSGELTVVINPITVEETSISPILVCNESEDRSQLEGTFNLTEIRQNHFQNQEVAFFSNLIDATLEKNPINENFRSGKTTIYIRYESNNQCKSIESLILDIKPLPELKIKESFQVCTDGKPLIINASQGFDSYIWYKIDSNTFQEIGTQATIAIDSDGNYGLEVGEKYISGGEERFCYSLANFIVTSSNKAVFEEITIQDFSDDNSIAAIVSGNGAYEFSLDGINYQNETLFENVAPGFYTLFARDKNGCGISEEDIAVVGFPKFFTPNADGTNDTWQLIGASRDIVQGDIYIYDRYGNLLNQFDTTSRGWDGTFRGKILPASDYWFKINFEGGRQFKGHFSLKR